MKKSENVKIYNFDRPFECIPRINFLFNLILKIQKKVRFKNNSFIYLLQRKTQKKYQKTNLIWYKNK